MMPNKALHGRGDALGESNNLHLSADQVAYSCRVAHG
jgi:hypothetical protein